MMSKETKTDDAGNKGFGLRGKVVDHKPGFDKGGQERKRKLVAITDFAVASKRIFRRDPSLNESVSPKREGSDVNRTI